jgi:hypothetical protein
MVRYSQSQINLLAALGLIDQTNIANKPTPGAGCAGGTLWIRTIASRIELKSVEFRAGGGKRRG